MLALFKEREKAIANRARVHDCPVGRSGGCAARSAALRARFFSRRLFAVSSPRPMTAFGFHLLRRSSIQRSRVSASAAPKAILMTDLIITRPYPEEPSESPSFFLRSSSCLVKSASRPRIGS